jgi:hypothetical protein
MPQPLRHNEARHDALRTAADGRLTFQSGMALSRGSYWAQLPGMPENEKTTTPTLSATVTGLVTKGYLRHVHAGLPRRSGPVEITDLGRETLARFDDIVAHRTANA